MVQSTMVPHAILSAYADEPAGQNSGILFEERTVTRGQAQRIGSVPRGQGLGAVSPDDAAMSPVAPPATGGEGKTGHKAASESTLPSAASSPIAPEDYSSRSVNDARSVNSVSPKNSENLLDSMDVYALSPHAARLALPRMIPQSAVEQWYTSHTDAPQSRLGIASADWSAIIQRASAATGLDAALIAAVIGVESDFNPHAVSSAGAQGAMQIMPTTQAELGLEDAFDPEQSVEAGSRYLRKQLDRFGSVELALAAYNAGPGAVERYGGVPPFKETQDYVRKVMRLYGRVAP